MFAANAFSLLGMVSLYFLLDSLLERFRYLQQGLAVILAYVAVKLLLEDVVALGRVGQPARRRGRAGDLRVAV